MTPMVLHQGQVPKSEKGILQVPPRIPPDFAPKTGEAAVLSLLAVRKGKDWVVVSGSLLTVPEAAARGSWQQWARQQPPTCGSWRSDPDADLEGTFTEDPFPDIRMTRCSPPQGNWEAWVREIEAGVLAAPGGPYRFDVDNWAAAKLFGQRGLTDAHGVLWGAQRPVQGVSLRTEPPEMPFFEGLWARGAQSSKPFGQRSRQELLSTTTFANWPIHLLGIHWPGTKDLEPPHAFVVGRTSSNIWIADAIPDYEKDLISIVLGWDAEAVDPFSCSVVLRSERDGAPLLASHWRVSDLPGQGASDEQGREAWELPWDQRTLSIVLPRGPRRTDWGMVLLGPEGHILDELPVGPRVERIEATFKVAGSDGPGVKSVSGDQCPQPTEAERQEAVLAARALDEETRARAGETADLNRRGLKGIHSLALLGSCRCATHP